MILQHPVVPCSRQPSCLRGGCALHRYDLHPSSSPSTLHQEHGALVLLYCVLAFRNAPLTGAELGSQLAAMGNKHRHVTSAHLAQQLARVVPQLYMSLDNLPSAELAAAAAVLEGQPSVWVGNGFVDASRVAFKVCVPPLQPTHTVQAFMASVLCLQLQLPAVGLRVAPAHTVKTITPHACTPAAVRSLLLLLLRLGWYVQGSMDLAPHLYVLPLELTPFIEVLAALGAQEAFSAAQYTTVLQVWRGCL